jgi:hypothetical protein
MNKRAIKQWIARTLLFLPSESAGQMLRRYRKVLDRINEIRRTDYGLFLMDWSKMLSDVNNMECDKPYFINKVGYESDATAICLYKRGSDQYVILDKCLYDTKKDDDGYRKEYWGNKTDDNIIWITLRGAIDNIEGYNQEPIRSVESKERGLSVWIARDKNGELYLYKSEPWRCKEDKNGHFDCDADEMFLPMDSDMFPEITWENSPKEFELKAVEE